MADNIQPFIQTGAVAILGAGFIILCRWMTSQMTIQLRDVSNAIRACALTQLDMHRTLITHDAQIRGVNPTAGNDAEEAHTLAEAEYKKILDTLENTSEAIRQSLYHPVKV